MSCGSAGFHRANKLFQEKKCNTGKFSSIDLTVTKGHWQVSDSRGDEACKGIVSSIILIIMSKAGAEPPSKLCIFVEQLVTVTYTEHFALILEILTH